MTIFMIGAQSAAIIRGSEAGAKIRGGGRFFAFFKTFSIYLNFWRMKMRANKKFFFTSLILDSSSAEPKLSFSIGMSEKSFVQRREVSKSVQKMKNIKKDFIVVV